MTLLLLGNIIPMACFIFTKILCTTNVGLLTDLVVNVIKKSLYHKSSLKSVNFIFFLGQTLFFVIFLCYRVKPFLAIPVAMVTIIRNVKIYYFVFVLQIYIM